MHAKIFISRRSGQKNTTPMKTALEFLQWSESSYIFKIFLDLGYNIHSSPKMESVQVVAW